MVLSKTSKVFLIILDLALLAFIVSDIARGYSPVERVVFWIAAGVEIALGYITFLVWMQSTLGKENSRYRMIAFVLIVVGVFAPTLIYWSRNGTFEPAETTERFYILAILTLLIYSSFIIKKYRAEHQRHKS